MKKFISIHTVYATPAWRINNEIYPKDGPVPEDGFREDGYKTAPNIFSPPIFIPKISFEYNYRPAETVSISSLDPEAHPAHFGFGEAVECLRAGYMVRRDGWQTKSTVVVKQVPTRVSGDAISNLRSLPHSVKKYIMDTTKTIKFSDQCLIVDGITGSAGSWVPTIEDIFADDWRIIE